MKQTSFILALVVSVLIICNNTALADHIMPQAKIESSQNTSYLANFQTATAKFIQQDFKGAIIEFDKAIYINPNNPQLYLNRGYVKQVINDFNGAMDDYNKAIALNPSYAYAYNNRGVLKVSLNDVTGAFEDYATALKINPKYSDVYYNRANLKYMTDDNQGALEDYNTAIELNPKDADAYNNRGVVKKRLNFNVGALSDYTQAIALNPKDSIAYANRGRLKKLYFDNEGASIDLDQAIALAETQTFIKNVKPLLSKESYIAAIPVSAPTPLDIIPKKVQQNNDKIVESNIKPVVQQPVEKIEEPIKTAVVQTPEFKAINEPVTDKVAIKNESKSSTGVISAGVATVKASSSSSITTTAVKQVPTTNVKLAESYYIRGLQKCVLKDLPGAIADLNKAIEHNSKYADAYYYRAAIRKELGDTDGFRKDYSTAIQMNPSLQAFNDSNCLTLISG